MCWECDNPDKTSADYLEVLRETIKKYGWAVQFIEDDRRPFAYTVGLYERRLPELLVTGLEPHMSVGLLNAIGGDMVHDNVRLQPGERLTHDGHDLLEVVGVEHPDVHLKYAIGMYGRAVTALQLVWIDDAGRWPWDRGPNRGSRIQPVLGVRGTKTR